MRIIIAGDIHGSALYCKKLLGQAELLQADKIILTGDLLYHGPRNDLPQGYAPKEVIELLNGIAEKLICVRGNCEAEVDQMVLSFPCLAEYIYLATEDFTAFITHGHIYNRENLPPFAKGSLLINGHTHIPAFEKQGEYTYINPGSVSIPKDNSDHSFILLEKDSVSFYTLDGEIYRREKI